MGKPIKNIQESADGLISFMFYENVEAGIRSVFPSKDNQGQLFNLNGQRLDRIPRGRIFIMNGSKHYMR